MQYIRRGLEADNHGSYRRLAGSNKVFKQLKRPTIFITHNTTKKTGERASKRAHGVPFNREENGAQRKDL